jgi:hypothetical protein
MNNSFECCHECTERHINCHSDCAKYISAKSEHDALSKLIREKEAPQSDFLGYVTNCIYKYKKQIGR